VARSAPRAPEIEAWQHVEHELVEGGLFPMLNARERDGEFQSFEQRALASESGRLMGFANINRDDGLAYVRRFAPDVIVSIRFGQIFKREVVALPRFGILNLHSGTLPDYRGVLATFWAMLEDAPEIGCTLHYVADGTIDTGPIIGTHRMAPEQKRSLLWNVASLYPGGVAMITEAIARLSRGEPIVATEQDAACGRYFSYPGEEQVAQFHARGNRLYSREDYAAILDGYGLSPSEIAAILK
jgi:methionyl-tRNA formyltransferase